MSTIVKTMHAVLVLAVLIWSARLAAQSGNASGTTLEEQFKSPPDSAKPRVWWHWVNGNVTQAGITADLEWMQRTGIGGMQMFDGDLGVSTFVDKPLIWMTPEWKSALRHAASEANRLHLEMGIAASGGWSESGGPWVKPSEGMKKYVWSETTVHGPMQFKGILAHPPEMDSKFQNLRPAQDFKLQEAMDMPGTRQKLMRGPDPIYPPFYADAAVVAYRTPSTETPMASLHPTITSSAGAIDGSLLMDGNYDKLVTLLIAPGADSGWIEFEFAKPYAVQAFSIAGAAVSKFGPRGLPSGEVQASDDGLTWRRLLTLPGGDEPNSIAFTIRTYSISPVVARFYRVVLKPAAINPSLVAKGFSPQHQVQLAEIELYSTPRVDRWEDKAAFGVLTNGRDTATPEASAPDLILKTEVVDLTSRMRPDGTLDWAVPAGNWTILRLGYSLTGEMNHPAMTAATGLEVDKLSRENVASYFEQYAKTISQITSPYFGKSLRNFVMDSWEAGEENWTGSMISEFRTRRGYDMTPYLPVLIGRVVESAAASDAFLWDFRRTLADMLAENYYGVARTYLERLGIDLYAEAMGTGLPTTGDALLNKGNVSVPMGEFWVPPPGRAESYGSDVKEASSAAHIYGKTYVATESFTTNAGISPWGEPPFYLKPIADENFARGVNRLFTHTSVQQPFVDERHKPGMTLGHWGQNYGRNITWADQAIAWNIYLARCSYLLQQGRYIADVAYFYGEGAPDTVPPLSFAKPSLPKSYSYDFVNADVLLRQASARAGKLHLASGMEYSLLVIPDDIHQLSMPLLEKLHELVEDGVTLISPRPIGSPSLEKEDASSRAYQVLANDLWGAEAKGGGLHAYGKGSVYTGKQIDEVLGAERVIPDFEYSAPTHVGPDVNYALPRGSTDADLVYIHREVAGTDIYFVSTQKPHAFDTKATFRVAGVTPELWHPDTGEMEPASYRIGNGRTVVLLHMEPEASVFVVFRKPTRITSYTAPQVTTHELTTLDGGWQLRFPDNWGAPSHVELNQLLSWSQSPDLGVRYFSGTATYAKQVNIPGNWFKPSAHLLIDLGMVREIAQVTINGVQVDEILWKPPFTVDVTRLLKPGFNRIEVMVTNLWPNRMIGDLQPGVTKTFTFTDFRAFTSDSPLMESGLLGPVKILEQNESVSSISSSATTPAP